MNFNNGSARGERRSLHTRWSSLAKFSVQLITQYYKLQCLKLPILRTIGFKSGISNDTQAS